MTGYRIEVYSKIKDSESKNYQKRLQKLGYNVEIEVSNVYTISHDFDKSQINQIADALHNEVVHSVRVNEASKANFDYAVEYGFLPGVTDNVATTVTEIINDLFKTKIGLNKVFSSKLLYIKGAISAEQVEQATKELINVLIQRYHIKTAEQYRADNGMDLILPIVKLTEEAKAIEVDLDVDEQELTNIGKKGILDPATNERRGPLALDADYMQAIIDYFKKEGRKPTDIELESLAQTWSEHCKHTYFAGRIDDIENGIYSEYIKRATNEIRKELAEKDFCISVFKDNSGSIIFDEEYMVSDKVETHNSPSALDPFGGSITGIVGVNRDCMGFGMGAKPIANRYGFCVGNPEDATPLYRGKNKTNPALSPKTILEGVVEGVNQGGNHSGIPTPAGFVNYDNSYKGKPLVFVGTVGLMPRKENGVLTHEKQAQDGDNIVVIGGRVGKDGIHGATFSSEVMDEGSPATAVQIGDPITQKKLSDVIVKEARQRQLYNSITDNGAGGISCSVAEMAKESGGFVVDLEKVPLKYPGLQPWETWISESQERITFSIADDKLEEFMQLMESRAVEATVIGKFNKGDRAVVKYNGKTIMDLEMDFLHEGLPKREFDTKAYPYKTTVPELEVENQQELFEQMISSNNIAGFEFISRQYDHEVQANSVIKPLQGKNSINGVASVIKPIPTNKKGVVLSQGMNPRLSELSAYDMAANSIDEAIRNAVSVGANVDHLALLDNFCWCSSNEPERIEQVKDAAKACYDYAKVYMTPYISGKDSMFNDFAGYDENDNPVKISANPTLLISSIGVVPDAAKTNTFDFKKEDDLIYIISDTKEELGGSELYHIKNLEGGKAPKVEAAKAKETYRKIFELTQKELLSSCTSIGRGGLMVALAKSAMASGKGVEVDTLAYAKELDSTTLFYSETPGRFVVSINPENKEAFENIMQSQTIAQIGYVSSEQFSIRREGTTLVESNINQIVENYKTKFRNF